MVNIYGCVGLGISRIRGISNREGEVLTRQKRWGYNWASKTLGQS
jgi:hypothetical protein